MERVSNRIEEYYSTWLATFISCCFVRSQERPHSYVEEEVEEEMIMGHQTATVPIRAKTIKRQSPIPGRYRCKPKRKIHDADSFDSL